MIRLPFRARRLPPTIPAGRRCYAIGDIHGCLDLFEAMLARIAAECRDWPRAAITIVLLGDLIDRGAESRGVVERARALVSDGDDVVVLKGNHEEALLAALDGDLLVQTDWLGFGGRACALSYGVPAALLDAGSATAIHHALVAAIPAEHVRFLEACPDSFLLGDYAFVHAGIRPGIAIDAQVPADLRWIRNVFLDDRRDHGRVIVHGHTIVRTAEIRPNRIGIDTGAYSSGRLTALRLEAAEQGLIEVTVDG